ncbi:hypothetical protein [Haloarchaeobius sp. DFWS5]|uniref:hypothetical protein n=1 Tax=Haloarchaeobius sp. DFWS5 TaxID=3446114 RepID=UPI003EBD4C73
MGLQFRPTTNPTGIEVVDTQAQTGFHLSLSSNEFTVSTARVPFEEYVTEKVAVETDHLTFDAGTDIHVRNEEMEVLERVGFREQTSLPAGTYVFDTTGPLKFYLRVDGAPTVSREVEQTRIVLERAKSVVIGCRSTWTTPQSTIETTPAPTDLAQVLSALSSSLTTLSPERAWPTLRNHPPKIEFSDELRIPEGTNAPETGIRLVVPPRLAPMLTAAPLVYYLGATVEVGDEPLLVTNEKCHHFGGSLGDEFVRLLRHTFILDCMVRAEGVFPVNPFFDESIVEQLPFGLAWAFEADPATRLDAYLSVAHSTVEHLVPRWSVVAYLPPTTESVCALPYIIDKLGIVRMPHGRRTEHVKQTVSGFLRETEPSSEFPGNSQHYIEPIRHEEAVEYAWFGPGTPVGGTCGTLSGYQHGVGERQKPDTVDIAVVCTDTGMLEEHRSLDALYDESSGIDRNVTLHTAASVDEVVSVLTDESVDLVHYIGHATADGLLCTDGELDIGSIETVSPRFFVLNACETYSQAKEFVQRGGVAGVATHTRIANVDATRIGRNIARLLGDGFPMSAAVEQGATRLEAGSQYLVIGDGNARVIASRGASPTILHLYGPQEGTYSSSMETYMTGGFQLGGQFTRYMDSGNDFLLIAGETPRRKYKEVDVCEDVVEQKFPIRYKDRLYWPETPEDVEAILKE